MVTFADFLIYDDAAAAIYDDARSQRHCRDCLTKLAEMVQRLPGMFIAEAVRKDARKGVAFKQRTLDDTEHSVFAQRLAKKLWQRPDERQKTKSKSGTTPAYGDFLRQSVQRQGDVLGDNRSSLIDHLHFGTINHVQAYGNISEGEQQTAGPRQPTARFGEMGSRPRWASPVV